MKKQQRPPLHFIRRLCTHLSDAENAEAEERFWRYLDIIGDIVRHTRGRGLNADATGPAQVDSTTAESDSTM